MGTMILASAGWRPNGAHSPGQAKRHPGYHVSEQSRPVRAKALLQCALDFYRTAIILNIYLSIEHSLSKENKSFFDFRFVLHSPCTNFAHAKDETTWKRAAMWVHSWSAQLVKIILKRRTSVSDRWFFVSARQGLPYTLGDADFFVLHTHKSKTFWNRTFR